MNVTAFAEVGMYPTICALLYPIVALKIQYIINLLDLSVLIPPSLPNSFSLLLYIIHVHTSMYSVFVSMHYELSGSLTLFPAGSGGLYQWRLDQASHTEVGI